MLALLKITINIYESKLKNSKTVSKITFNFKSGWPRISRARGSQDPPCVGPLFICTKSLNTRVTTTPYKAHGDNHIYIYICKLSFMAYYIKHVTLLYRYYTSMATDSTPLTRTDEVDTPVSGSEYISLSKHETDRSPTCLKPRCCVYAALL